MNTGSSPSDVAWLSMSLLLIDLDILTTSEGVMEPLILLLIGSDSTNCMLNNTNRLRAAGMIGVFILIANSYDMIINATKCLDATVTIAAPFIATSSSSHCCSFILMGIMTSPYMQGKSSYKQFCHVRYST